jgi:general secretion pathway protein F
MSDKLHTYDIKILDRSSKTTKNVDVSAVNFEEARVIALTQGNVLNVKRKGFSLSAVSLSQNQRIRFMDDLGTMLSSKVSLGDALKEIEYEYTGNIKKLASVLKRRVDDGNDFIESLAMLGEKAFPQTIISLIEAGTQTGNTGEALKDAAAFERDDRELKKESGKGMFGAIAAFILSGILLLATIFYIKPEMDNSPLFKEYSIETPVVDIMLSITSVIMSVIMVLAVFIILLRTIIKWTAPYFADKVVMKIPFYRDVALSRNTFITFYGLSKLIKSGVSTEQSLLVTMENTKKGVLKSDLREAHSSLIRGEKDWPNHLSSLRSIDKSSIKNSINREHTAENLNNVSMLYKRMYIDKVTATVAVLNSISNILFGFVGFIILYLSVVPMSDLMSKIN